LPVAVVSLTTSVSRFVVDHGRVTEEGGRLRSFQRRRLDEPDVDLHVLAEPSGDKGDELGAQALDAIGRLFLQDRLSLTGGLVRALRSTHQTLVEWNRRSLPREQVNVGLTAAAVSGPLVYLAQAGPSLVYLRQEGRLKRLLPAEEAVSPLGESDLDPAVQRLELQPGDILLASSLALETILDYDTLEGFLSRGSEEALPELYLLTRDLPNFALFAITCAEAGGDDAEEPEDAAAIPEHLRAGAQPQGVQPRTPIVLDPGPEPEPEPVLANPPPLDISRPVVRLRANPLGGEYTRTTGPARRFQLRPEPRFLALLGAIALVLFVGAFAVPDLVRQGRGERLEELIAGAQTQLAAAQNEADPTRRRQFFEDTSRLTTEALRIDPQNPTAEELRQQATAGLQTMDAVFDLGPLTTVTTLGRQLTGEVSLAALTVAGGSAYLLDDRGRRIISVSLSGGGPPTVVFLDGEAYAGTPAKQPLVMTWQGNAASGRLLVLDAERKLFEFRPGSAPQPLPLRRTNTWSSVAGIATFDSNFYVLDPRADQVHRYLPAAVGFDSEPSLALTSGNDLDDALGLAVDGEIFVFEADKLHRFRSGSDLGFALAGIDRQPRGVTAIEVVGDEVYIADSANKRVVVAGKDGVFRRQLVASAFTDLRALAVDPQGGQLYVVVGDALLTAPIVR
jgi:hypothetical protein